MERALRVCAQPLRADWQLQRRVYSIDESQRGREFLGYGVNPSAGTYRLLHDYPEPQRSELLAV